MSGPVRFLLVLLDNPQTGEIEIAGIQEPEEFCPTSPAHIVGKWIGDNLESIIISAEADKVKGLRLLSTAPEAGVQVALPSSHLGVSSGDAVIVDSSGAATLPTERNDVGVVDHG